MGWRTIIIAKPSKISLKNNNFLYTPENEQSITVPMNDISVIILETHRVTITSALLSRLADENILLFSCDNKHTPNGVFTPFHQHSRFSLMVHLQTQWSEPFKKQIWQQIIVSKIKNQAKTLEMIGKIKESKELIDIASRVKSGDKDNLESYSAKIYFTYLFNNFMRRDVSDWRNSALNYGYSIIRGLIARDLSASGFIPAIGIHHKNQLNSFNLADDFIEPYRAFIDFEVYKMKQKYSIPKHYELTSSHKIQLVELLQKTIRLDKENYTILHSTSIAINTLASASKEKNTKNIILPEFSYE